MGTVQASPGHNLEYRRKMTKCQQILQLALVLTIMAVVFVECQSDNSRLPFGGGGGGRPNQNRPSFLGGGGLGGRPGGFGGRPGGFGGRPGGLGGRPGGLGGR